MALSAKLEEPKPPRKPPQVFVRVLRTVLLTIVVGGLFLMWKEESLIFHPVKYPEGYWEPTFPDLGDDSITPQIEDVWLTAADGTRIHAWFVTPVRGPQREPVETTATVLLCHGNAGNLSDRVERLSLMVQFPVSLLIFDYRGFGRSEGKPSEAGAYQDANAAWNYLVDEREIPEGQLVIFGVSLGGAVAAAAAEVCKPAGLILESTFTSVPEMAGRAYPFVPKFMIRTKMNTLRRIQHLSMPKLILHSPGDEIIPYEFGEALFDAAAQPKTFYPLPDCRHNETVLCGGKEYLSQLRQFIGACTPTE